MAPLKFHRAVSRAGKEVNGGERARSNRSGATYGPRDPSLPSLFEMKTRRLFASNGRSPLTQAPRKKNLQSSKCAMLLLQRSGWEIKITVRQIGGTEQLHLRRYAGGEPPVGTSCKVKGTLPSHNLTIFRPRAPEGSR